MHENFALLFAQAQHLGWRKRTGDKPSFRIAAILGCNFLGVHHGCGFVHLAEPGTHPLAPIRTLGIFEIGKFGRQRIEESRLIRWVNEKCEAAALFPGRDIRRGAKRKVHHRPGPGSGLSARSADDVAE